MMANNLTKKLLEELDKRDFRLVDDVIHIFAGGSHQHGARIDSSGDLDICGVYIEPKELALGIDTEEHFITSTAVQGERNTSADVDYSMYSLRKWARLAAKGNPTVLSYLFMPAVTPLWKEHIYDHRHLFLASSHAHSFLGFASSQLKRMQGLKGQGKHGQRPEIENVHGYDTKATMHMIRMMLECRELLDTGSMTFPNPEVDLLIDIRLGKLSKTEVENLFNELEAGVLNAQLRSKLPAQVDRQAISKVVSEACIEHWFGDSLYGC